MLNFSCNQVPFLYNAHLFSYTKRRQHPPSFGNGFFIIQKIFPPQLMAPPAVLFLCHLYLNVNFFQRFLNSASFFLPTPIAGTTRRALVMGFFSCSFSPSEYTCVQGGCCHLPPHFVVIFPLRSLRHLYFCILVMVQRIFPPIAM